LDILLFLCLFGKKEIRDKRVVSGEKEGNEETGGRVEEWMGGRVNKWKKK